MTEGTYTLILGAYDKTIDTVNSKGVVTGVKAGTATITAKSLSFDVVPVDTLSGIGFATVGKQKLETGKEDKNNGAEAGLADTITESVPKSNLNGSDGLTVKITGKYNGKELNIPSDYYTINDSNVEVTGNKITAVKADVLKWSDLYDSNSARLTRKDATLTIAADVFNDAAKTNKNASIKLNIKLSDETRKATTLVIKNGAAATKNATATDKTIKNWFVENQERV